MKKYILILLACLFSLQIFSQDSLNVKRKLRFPAWITHSQNTDVLGLSLAAFPKGILRNDTTLTRTYGIRLEASVVAIFAPLMGRSPISRTKNVNESKQEAPLTEIIYGINLSSGTFAETKVNGFSAGLLIQYLYNMNGISMAGMSNLIENHNGIAISGFGNEVYKSNGILIGFGNLARVFNGIQIGGFNEVMQKGVGLQIGIFNEATNFKGLQFGLWNKNDKRSLPLLNWQFKS